MIRRCPRRARAVHERLDADVDADAYADADIAAGAGVAPSGLAVAARYVRTGARRYSGTLVVVGYPREVWPGWLEPLTSLAGRVDVSVHISPIDPATATTRLRRRLARLEAGMRFDSDHGRLQDPYAEAAAEDAYLLAERVARGEGRLFIVTLTLTAHANNPQALAALLDEVRTVAAGLLLDARPTSYRALQGWLTALPLASDRLGQARTFDTDALATAFPMAAADLSAPHPPDGPIITAAPPAGVLYGHNLGGRSLVFWDRFGCDNYNSVILGRSGAGKSYLVKLELLRSLYRGIHAHVIDPEDEYTRLAAAMGAAVMAIPRKRGDL